MLITCWTLWDVLWQHEKHIACGTKKPSQVARTCLCVLPWYEHVWLICLLHGTGLLSGICPLTSPRILFSHSTHSTPALVFETGSSFFATWGIDSACHEEIPFEHPRVVRTFGVFQFWFQNMFSTIWNLKALRKQCGSSQDRSWSVFSAQEQPQEVAEVLPAAAKKGSKVQLRLCSCRASRIFASFLQSAAIRPIYSAFMWFVEQAWLQFFQNFDRCRRSPVWRWKHRQLQRHALVCDMMHHCATDLTEPCRPDDQCDNAIDGNLYVMDLFCQLGIVRNRIKANVDHMLVTLGFPCGTWKPYESNLGPLKTGPEVCLVHRNSRKKLRKYFQLLRRKLPRSDSACVPVEHPAFSHHFYNLLRYVQSILLSCDLSSKHGSNFFKILIGAEGAQCEDGSTCSCRGMLWFARFRYILPVVPQKAVSEVLKIGHYRKGELLWCMDGRANPLTDRKVVGVFHF